MPIKTITATVDGKLYKVTADIPDDATDQELQDAVEAYTTAHPLTEAPAKAPITAADVGQAAVSALKTVGTTARDVALVPAAVVGGSIDAINRIGGGLGGWSFNAATGDWEKPITQPTQRAAPPLPPQPTAALPELPPATAEFNPTPVAQATYAYPVPQLRAAAPAATATSEVVGVEKQPALVSGANIRRGLKKVTEATGGGGALVTGELKTPALYPSYDKYVKAAGKSAAELSPEESDFWHREYAHAIKLKPVYDFLGSAIGSGQNVLSFAGEQIPVMLAFDVVGNVLRGPATAMENAVAASLERSAMSGKLKAAIRLGTKETTETVLPALAGGGALGYAESPTDRITGTVEGAKGALAFIGAMRIATLASERLTPAEQAIKSDLLKSFDENAWSNANDFTKPAPTDLAPLSRWDRYKALRDAMEKAPEGVAPEAAERWKQQQAARMAEERRLSGTNSMVDYTLTSATNDPTLASRIADAEREVPTEEFDASAKKLYSQDTVESLREQLKASEQRALEAERKAAAAEKAGSVDALTGLSTRGGLQRAREASHQTAIIFDVDHFKTINDTYGHPTGDVVLQFVSQRLKDLATRNRGAIGRIGGEEIAIYLPGDVANAMRVAEEGRQLIGDTPVDAYGHKIPVTISGGVDVIDPGEIGWQNADVNLYIAKRSGRNRIVGPETPIPEGVAAPRKAPESSPKAPETAPAEPKGPVAEAPTAETKPAGLAKRTADQAASAKLVEDLKALEDLPQYKTMNMADQAQRTVDLIASDPEAARRIALGEQEPPKDLHAVSVYLGVKERALQQGDVETLRDLATKSKVPVMVSEAGQTLRATREALPEDPVAAIQEVQVARRTAAEKRGGLEKKVETEVTSAKEHMRSALREKTAWNDFVNTIRCK